MTCTQILRCTQWTRETTERPTSERREWLCFSPPTYATPSAWQWVRGEVQTVSVGGGGGNLELLAALVKSHWVKIVLVVSV